MKRVHVISKNKQLQLKVCEINNYFGITLREIRLKKGITQEKAAELLSVTQSQWSLYESGRNKPTLDTVVAIAKVLKEDPFDLIALALSKSKYISEKKPTKRKAKAAV